MQTRVSQEDAPVGSKRLRSRARVAWTSSPRCSRSGLGLSILYFAVALLGAVDPFGDSIVFTIIALVLMVAWLGAAYQRSRADTGLLTRPDRERRGF